MVMMDDPFDLLRPMTVTVRVTRASPVPKSSALSTPLSPLAAKCCARPWPGYAVVQWRLPSSLPLLELTRRRVAKPSILAIWPAL